MPVPNRVNVNVSVDDAHVSQIDQVAARLRPAGMHVDRTLAAIGSISGHVTGNLVQARAQGARRIGRRA